MDEVAERAGVGRTTVFQQFESKSGLLRALDEDVGERAGVVGLLRELEVPDARQALRAAFEVGCRVWAAEAPMFRKLFGFSAIDKEMQQITAQKEEIRRGLVTSLVSRLARQNLLRPGVSRRKAEDLLWLLTGFESFDTLYRERESAAQVAELLLQLTSSFVELGHE